MLWNLNWLGHGSFYNSSLNYSFKKRLNIFFYENLLKMFNINYELKLCGHLSYDKTLNQILWYMQRNVILYEYSVILCFTMRVIAYVVYHLHNLTLLFRTIVSATCSPVLGYIKLWIFRNVSRSDTGCKNASMYGINCNLPCSTNCKDNLCHIESGACFKCKPGWNGISCNESKMRNCVLTDFIFLKSFSSSLNPLLGIILIRYVLLISM